MKDNFNLEDVVFNLILEEGHPLTTREITDLINERELYHPYGEKRTISISQISNVAKQNPLILERDLSFRPMKIDIVDKNYVPTPNRQYSDTLADPIFLNVSNYNTNLIDNRDYDVLHYAKVILFSVVLLLFAFGLFRATLCERFDETDCKITVSTYIQRNLTYPKTYVPLTWDIKKNGDIFIVKHIYRFKDEFGKTYTQNKVYKITSDGLIISDEYD